MCGKRKDSLLSCICCFQAFAILEDLGAKVKTSSRKRIHKDENEREKESKRPRVKEEKEPPVESKPPPPPSSGPNNTVSPGQIQAQQVCICTTSHT